MGQAAPIVIMIKGTAPLTAKVKNKLEPELISQSLKIQNWTDLQVTSMKMTMTTMRRATPMLNKGRPHTSTRASQTKANATIITVSSTPQAWINRMIHLMEKVVKIVVTVNSIVQ